MREHRPEEKESATGSKADGACSVAQDLGGWQLAAGISLVAVLAAVLHMTFRDVPVDNLTIVLAIIAAAPWLARILRSLTLPGGITMEFRELTQKVDTLDARVAELQQFVIEGVGTRQRSELAAYLVRLREYVSDFGARVSEPPPVYVEGTGMASHYDPRHREIVIQREFAHDLDIVARTYMHSVLFARSTPEEQEAWDFEMSGLESGLADYYVSSAKGQSYLYERSSLRTIDLANDRAFTEEFDTEDVGNDLGEIWGGAFWKVRDLLGKRNADAALWNAWGNTDLTGASSREGGVRVEFVNQLAVAVKSQHGTEKARQVREVFASRGLPSSAE